jgi:transcriptional regulator with XRE-family HTH domain
MTKIKRRTAIDQSETSTAWTRGLGERIREVRRARDIDVNSAALAAGVSRITWFRIERGFGSVHIGAYAKALEALGIRLNEDMDEPGPSEDSENHIPVRVQLARYPQLRQIAWHVRAEDISPTEARDIYARNWNHINVDELTAIERNLVVALKLGLDLDVDF